MTQAFTTYTFKADDAEAGQIKRSLPTRLLDVINVKDFGAVGNGIVDDTPAFNAAIDYAWSIYTVVGNGKTEAGATIFIPAGTYHIGTPPLSFDGNRDAAAPGAYGGCCNFMGAGRDVSVIKGTYFTGEQPEHHNNSFLVTCGGLGIKGVGKVSNLTIWNESQGIASGAFMIGGSGNEVNIDNCHFKGFIGYVHSIQTFGSSITNCLFTCTKPITSASSATLSPLYDPNNFLEPLGGPSTAPGRLYASVGMAVAQIFAANCTAIGFDVGFTWHTIGSDIIGCKAVQCGIGFMGGYRVGTFGRGENFEAGYPSSGAKGGGSIGSLASNRAERCTWGIYGFQTITASNVIYGADGPYTAATINGMLWNGGNFVVTVATSVAHNLVTGDKVCIVPATWTPVPATNIVVVTVTDGTHFTYPGPTSTPPSFTTGTWNYPREYGITIGQGGVDVILASNVPQGPVSIASVAIAAQTATRNRFMCMRAPNGWSFPDQYNNAAPSWEFFQCNTPYIISYAGLTDWNVYHPGMQPTMEFNISDGSPGPGSAVFGATITGGGANRYKIRYNGTNWTRVG